MKYIIVRYLSNIRFNYSTINISNFLSIGYACKPYLFTPLRTPVTPSKRKYNKCQIRTRNIIERTFGIWKRKFPCLRRCLANAPGTTVNIILSCALLHNISRKYNQYTTDSDEEEEDLEEEDGEVAGEIDHSILGPAARQAYIIRHFS